MTTRWILAAVASIGAGVLAVPMILGSEPPIYMDEPPLAASHGSSASCKADRNMNFDLTVKDMRGANVRLSDFKGKAILLNYWATWCGPCKAEIPIFNELYAQYKDRDFVILGISSDDTVPMLQEFVKTLPMTYPVLLAEDREEVLGAAGPIYGYPTTFYIDRTGAVCGHHVGLGTKESFEKAIEPLL